jgi:hypothetical protein
MISHIAVSLVAVAIVVGTVAYTVYKNASTLNAEIAKAKAGLVSAKTDASALVAKAKADAVKVETTATTVANDVKKI